MWMTRLALTGKCGSFGASGESRGVAALAAADEILPEASWKAERAEAHAEVGSGNRGVSERGRDRNYRSFLYISTSRALLLSQTYQMFESGYNLIGRIGNVVKLRISMRSSYDTLPF